MGLQVRLKKTKYLVVKSNESFEVLLNVNALVRQDNKIVFTSNTIDLQCYRLTVSLCLNGRFPGRCIYRRETIECRGLSSYLVRLNFFLW